MSKPVEYETLPLKAIRSDSQDEYHIYLVITVEGDERHPVELGTGRNAVVFLGSSTANLQAVSQEYYAVKFLKNDPDKEYTRVTEDRFFIEAQNTHSFGQLGDSFVKYNSWGAIHAETDKPLSDVWVKFFGDRINTIVNTGERYTAILESYYLQGPFYAIELCQATLYDLLDRNTPWLELPVYHMQPPRAPGLPSYEDALNKTAQSLGRSIDRIVSQYMTGDIYNKSGYDILNAFKDEPKANQVRNYAVLELFAHIVSVVRVLHSHPRKLAHRDLKPGNVFIAHDANFDGIKTITVKLGDLGFTAELKQLNTTNFSLGYGIQNPAAMAPGSQFYRAPEQAELPIEVRVSFEKRTPNRVRVYSSKMSNIQVGDRLVIGDPFKKGAQRRSTDQTDHDTVQTVFKIDEVLRDKNRVVGFVLDGALTIDKTEDIWAHVVRATGYHTDGYSLGAILYDLASGGRNPESFYIYCLVRFIEEFSHIKYSIDDIVEALAPSFSLLGNQTHKANIYANQGSGHPLHAVHAPTSARTSRSRRAQRPRPANGQPLAAPADQQLGIRERLALSVEIFKATNIEHAVERILNSRLDTKVTQSAASTAQDPHDLLTVREKWEILKVVMGTDHVDELIDLILHSTLDVKMELQRMAGEPIEPSALSMGEKWELLRLVMNANNAQGVLGLVFSSALERVIAHEQKPTPDIPPTTTTSLHKKWDYFKIVMQSDDLEALVEGIVQSALSHNYQKEDDEKLKERLRDYRFRSFHIVNELLTDKRGVPIPADIIRIVVKCMLRNFTSGTETSYYASPPGKGFLADEDVEAVNRIYNDTQERLTDVQNQLPPGFPDELNKDLLFKLRSMVAPPAPNAHSSSTVQEQDDSIAPPSAEGNEIE